MVLTKYTYALMYEICFNESLTFHVFMYLCLTSCICRSCPNYSYTYISFLSHVPSCIYLCGLVVFWICFYDRMFDFMYMFILPTLRYTCIPLESFAFHANLYFGLKLCLGICMYTFCFVKTYICLEVLIAF